MRVRRGLYRFRDYPTSPREDVMAAWLAAGAETVAVSHESALDLLELSDVVPGMVHLTIPRAKRYRPASHGVAIHTTTRPLGPADVTIRNGVRVTTAARSIVDAAAAETAPEQIIAATVQAVQRGMTTKKQLIDMARTRSARVQRLIERALAGDSTT